MTTSEDRVVGFICFCAMTCFIVLVAALAQGCESLSKTDRAVKIECAKNHIKQSDCP